MLLRKLLLPLLDSSTQQLNSQDNQAKQKDKNAYTVDAVHIPNPLVLWPVRIFLFEVEIFRYLFPDSHISKVITSLLTASI